MIWRTLLFGLLLFAAAAWAQTPPLILPDVNQLDALVGQPVSIQFSVQNPPTGGVNGGWAITSGSLPAGLTFSTTGLLSGTPTTPQSTSFVVSTVYTFPFAAAFIPPLTVSRTYLFNVDNQLRILTSSPLPAATAGRPVNYIITATLPSTWSYELNDLPPGITVNLPEGSVSMSITGVFPPVSAPTTYSIDLYAFGGSYVSQSDHRLFRIPVNPAPVLSEPAATAFVGKPYSSAMTVSGGTSPFTFGILGGSLPPGLSLNPSTGAITGSPISAGDYNFAGTVTDVNGASTFGNFLIRVLPPPLEIQTQALPAGAVGVPYTASILAANGTPPYSFRLAGGLLPPGITLSATGSLSGTPTQPGPSSFSVQVTDSAGGSAFADFAIQIRVAPLTVTTTSLANGLQGAPYNAALSASGGVPPYAWSLSSGSLPPGLSLDPATGALTGTPTATSSYAFTAEVRDSARSTASRSFTIRIYEPLRILTTALPDGAEDRSYSASLDAAGGSPPYAFSLASGSLPAGLTLSSAGQISGTPAVSGEFAIAVLVTDSEGFTAQRPFIVVIILRPAILTESLPEGQVGDAYAVTLSGQGKAPLAWSISSGALPSGLTLNSQTGAITGTPAQPGDFSFEVTLADGRQPPLTAVRSFTLHIGLPPLPNLTITQLADTTPPASQPTFGLQLERSFPVVLNGTATLSFAPDGDLPPDPAIRFANGGTSVNFSIPAGQTDAVPVSGSLFAFQTGTTAGTITLTVTLRLGSTVLEPAPFLVRTVRIPPSGPGITGVTIVRTSAGFEVRVSGYSNIRQITGATFRFIPLPGAQLGTAEVTVPVASAFQAWFGSQESRQYGGQFLLVVPFNVQGSFSALASLQVTLTNSAGSGSGSANF